MGIIADLRIQWVKALLAQGEYGRICSKFRKRIHSGHIEGELAFLVGQALYNDNEFLLSEKALRKSIASGHDDADTRWHLAMCMSKLDRLEDSIEEYKNLLPLFPNDETLRSNIGMVYAKMALNYIDSDPEKASAAISKASEFAPSDEGVITVARNIARIQEIDIQLEALGRTPREEPIEP